MRAQNAWRTWIKIIPAVHERINSTSSLPLVNIVTTESHAILGVEVNKQQQ